MIVDEVVGRIDAFAELGQDDLLLALEMLLVEMRRAHEIGDQLGDERQVAGQRPAVKHRLVARGPGVERSADILDRFGERARVAAAGALEHHMLDEMREAAELLRLGARADARIEAERDRLRARQRVDRDGQAIRQDVHARRSRLGLSSSSASARQARR